MGLDFTAGDHIKNKLHFTRLTFFSSSFSVYH